MTNIGTSKYNVRPKKASIFIKYGSVKYMVPKDRFFKGSLLSIIFYDIFHVKYYAMSEERRRFY
jgi:hypothetical protein